MKSRKTSTVSNRGSLYLAERHKCNADVPTEEISDVSFIRRVCPELGNWSDSEVWSAWGTYSHEIHMVWWQKPHINYAKQFLKFLIWTQENGEWHRGLPEELEHVVLPERELR